MWYLPSPFSSRNLGVEKLKTTCQILATPPAGLLCTREEVPCIFGSMKIGSAQGDILSLCPWNPLGCCLILRTRPTKACHQCHHSPGHRGTSRGIPQLPAASQQSSSSVGTCMCILFACANRILYLLQSLVFFTWVKPCTKLPRRTGSTQQEHRKTAQVHHRFVQFPESLTERWLDCMILQSYWWKLFATMFTLASWWHLSSIC